MVHSADLFASAKLRYKLIAICLVFLFLWCCLGMAAPSKRQKLDEGAKWSSCLSASCGIHGACFPFQAIGFSNKVQRSVVMSAVLP